MNFSTFKKGGFWMIVALGVLTLALFSIWFSRDKLLVIADDIGSERIVKVLLIIGANPNRRHGEIDDTPLINAARNGHARTMEVLLETRIDIDARNRDGLTALMYASANDCIRCVDLLIGKKCNVNQKDNIGKSALTHAAMNRHLQVSRLLIENGADVNAQTVSGDTALMAAARAGRADILTLLLDSGADPFIIDSNGRTALSVAEENKKEETAALLRMRMTRGAAFRLKRADVGCQSSAYGNRVWLHRKLALTA